MMPIYEYIHTFGTPPPPPPFPPAPTIFPLYPFRNSLAVSGVAHFMLNKNEQQVKYNACWKSWAKYLNGNGTVF